MSKSASAKSAVPYFRIALAQLNPIVGDIAGNARKAAAAHAKAAALGADLIVFPELFLNGYPPEDLVLKPAFQGATAHALDALAGECRGAPAMLIGTIWREDGKLYNAAALLSGGAIETVRLKADLPNYGVFDEKRVFASGPMPGPISINGVRIGVPICEDIWGEEVVECLAETGAEILLVPNGSPYEGDKTDTRLNIAVSRVTESRLPLVYLNQIGGQDELVFDGASFGLNVDGALAFQMPACREEIRLVTPKQHPRDLIVLLHLAGGYLSQNRNEQPISTYARVIEHYPDHVPSLNNLAWLNRDKDPKRAMDYANQARRLAPNDPYVLDTLGQLALNEGDAGRALGLLREAARHAPAEPEIQLHLAAALIKQERLAEAVQILTPLASTLASKLPDSPLAREAKTLLDAAKARMR